MDLFTRRTKDPLLDYFLQEGINPLSYPRSRSPVGMIYAVNPGGWFRRPSQTEWRPSRALTPELPQIETVVDDAADGETLTRQLSSDLDLAVTVQVIGRVLPMLDEAGKGELKAALEMAGASTCALRLVEPKIERLQIDDLQIALRSMEFSEAFAEVLKDNTAYFCTTGWAAKTLEVTAKTKDKTSADILTNLQAVLDTKGEIGLSVSQGYASRVRLAAKESRFFGAGLMRIDHRTGGGLILKGYRPETMLASEDDTRPTAIDEIWDEDAVILLDVSPEA